MKSDDRRQLLIYGLTGTVCVGVAFLLSLKFIGKTRAQEGQNQQPSAAAATAAPAPGQAPTGAAGNPPAGTQPGAQPGQAAQPSARPGGTATELSELEGFLEPFIYDQVNRRDPFLPYAEYAPTDTSAPPRPLSPAQRFDLDQLRLVGIMWDIKEPKAMFMDPEAEVLVLGRDEGIGNRNGYIAAIREGEVVVVEAIRKRGDIIYKTRVLRMER